MIVALQENVRIRLAADVKEAWQSTCDAKRITQQAAIDALLRWFTQQDSLMQSLILGQIEEKDCGDVTRLLLERMARTAHPPIPQRLGAVIGGREPPPTTCTVESKWKFITAKTRQVAGERSVDVADCKVFVWGLQRGVREEV